jgi:hypothetical protein
MPKTPDEDVVFQSQPPVDVEWIEDDPGAVRVGVTALDIADDDGLSFVEATSRLFDALPPTYRTPRRRDR